MPVELKAEEKVPMEGVFLTMELLSLLERRVRSRKSLGRVAYFIDEVLAGPGITQGEAQVPNLTRQISISVHFAPLLS